MPSVPDFSLACPIPIRDSPRVLLAHGGGGELMHRLIEDLFRAAFGSAPGIARHDGAVFAWPPPPQRAAATAAVVAPRLAFTTDSYVVRPLFFPGGDIGTLAVNGTVNDLAMCGARPLYLSAGFILEEGLPMADLWRIVRSMRAAADAAGVAIVTGDTKVVDRGKGDGVFINTAGVGAVEHPTTIAPTRLRPGDAVLLNGDIGRHGIAILAAREGLAFEASIESDCAPLVRPVLDLLEAGIEVRCLRDCTRGGLATTLVELAEESATDIELDERAVEVHEQVAGACEILGFDPLYIANEGRFVAVVADKDADRALEILQRAPTGGIETPAPHGPHAPNANAANAARPPEASAHASAQGDGASNANAARPRPCRIGRVAQARSGGRLVLKTSYGVARLLDRLSGEQLPRIC